MSIKEIKEQIHLLTTVKLLLQIDGRINEWDLESELIELKNKLHKLN